MIMKKQIHYLLIGAFVVIGVAATPLVTSTAGAIDVFSGADCGTSGGGTGAAGGGAGTGLNGGTGGAGGAAGANNGAGGGGGSSSSLCGAVQTDEVSTLTQNVITALFVILGAIAVIMIIIGGIRYTTSNGDSSQTKAAKDTILYAVIGLVVAIMAYAIVSFTLEAFTK